MEVLLFDPLVPTDFEGVHVPFVGRVRPDGQGAEERAPDLLVEAIFDTGVHAGPRRAIEVLQRAAGTEDDGIIGRLTIRACQRTPARRLTARFLAQRGLFLGYLVGRDPSQGVFRDGWANRLAEFVERMNEA